MPAREKYLAKRQRRDEGTCCEGREEESEREGRKFHENEKKERIFPIPSSTSRTLIRRSGFTLTPGNPFPVPLLSAIALSFSFSYTSRILLYPAFFISLLPSSGISAVFEKELVTSRAFQIPLGITGSAVAMLLPSRKKQIYGYGEKRTRWRKYKRARGREGER